MFSKKCARLIGRLEKIVKAFFNVTRGVNATVEICRQDSSGVSAVWTTMGESLTRSVDLVVSERQNSMVIDFGASVWWDDTENAKRYWRHKPQGELYVKPYKGEALAVAVTIKLERIFHEAALIRRGALANISDLHALP